MSRSKTQQTPTWTRYAGQKSKVSGSMWHKDLDLLLGQETSKHIWEFCSSAIMVIKITLYKLATGLKLETRGELPFI